MEPLGRLRVYVGFRPDRFAVTPRVQVGDLGLAMFLLSLGWALEYHTLILFS